MADSGSFDRSLIFFFFQFEMLLENVLFTYLFSFDGSESQKKRRKVKREFNY